MKEEDYFELKSRADMAEKLAEALRGALISCSYPNALEQGELAMRCEAMTEALAGWDALDGE